MKSLFESFSDLNVYVITVSPHIFIRALVTFFVRYEICSVLHANYSSTIHSGVQLSLENWITWSGFMIQTNQTAVSSSSVSSTQQPLLSTPQCSALSEIRLATWNIHSINNKY